MNTINLVAVSEESLNELTAQEMTIPSEITIYRTC